MFWKEDQKSVVGSFKDTCTVAVHCWYIKDCFAGSVDKFLKKKMFSRWLLLLEFKAYFEKYIPSPETSKFYVIPSCNLSWYADQPVNTLVLSSCNPLLRLYASSSSAIKTIHKTESRNSTLVFPSNFICDHLFVDYQHLQKYWATASSVKSISENTLCSVKSPLFDNIILPTLKKVKRFQISKIDVFIQNLDPHTSTRLNRKKGCFS